MSQAKTPQRKLTIEFDATELTPAQIRLIRSLNASVAGLVVAVDESEFFEGSAELLKICASLIQQSHFPNNTSKEKKTIKYGEQALEYSIDTLQEAMAKTKSVTYDN